MPAVSAGTPLLPRKLLSLGSVELLLSLVVTASVLAIVTVPAWAAALGPWLGRTLERGAGDVAAADRFGNRAWSLSRAAG